MAVIAMVAFCFDLVPTTMGLPLFTTTLVILVSPSLMTAFAAMRDFASGAFASGAVGSSTP